MAVPGLAADRGRWTTLPGVADASLALACVVLAIAAVRPTRAAARGLAVAAAILVAPAPGAGVVMAALGPGTVGGEAVLASGGHIHSHGSPESTIVFQPLPGGRGGHYVYRAKATPRPTPIGVAPIVSAAFIFAYGAVAHLRRRCAPAGSLGLASGEGSLA